MGPLPLFVCTACGVPATRLTRFYSDGVPDGRCWCDAHAPLRATRLAGDACAVRGCSEPAATLVTDRHGIRAVCARHARTGTHREEVWVEDPPLPLPGGGGG